MPGQEKMYSTRIAPPTIQPIDSATSVAIGSSAFRTTCLAMIRRSVRPLALAVST